MIQPLSRIEVIDNSGAKIGRCIKVLRPKGKKYAEVGDLIILSIQKTQVLKGSTSPSREQIMAGDLYKAIVVRSQKEKTEKNGVKMTAENGAILVKLSAKTGEYTPIGTRIKGPVSSRLSEKAGMEKILSLAKAVL
jgi:large subunit ribosomal protein L14